MIKPRFSIFIVLVLTTIVAHYLTKRRQAYGLINNGGLVRNTMVPFVINVDQPMGFIVNDQTWQTNANFRRTYVGLCGCYWLVSNYRLEDEGSPIQIIGYHNTPIQANDPKQAWVK